MKLLKAAPFALLTFALNALPATAQTNRPSLKWDSMDLGPFQSGTFKINDQATAKGIAIKVGTGQDAATILFDTELLRVSAAWTGGFIQFPRGRGGLEGTIAPEGTLQFSTNYFPGWAKGTALGEDTRDRHQGHLPADAAKWRGLYINGEKVILNYTVGAAQVLELPGYESRGTAKVFTRTFSVAKTTEPITLFVAELRGGTGSARDGVAEVTSGESATLLASVTAQPAGSKLEIIEGRVTLTVPPLADGATFSVVTWSGPKAQKPSVADMAKVTGALPDLTALCKGGPAHWGEPLETKGILGEVENAPYVADEITLPDDARSKSWMRPGGHDFLPDGTAVLVNVSGDVWLVSGLDDKLESVKWKRFATGLFQPLGCKVVDGQIYVLGRDQITRLRDLNGDGEADFYECFNNDCVVLDNYHEFALDLQTDSKGNFFYGKGSPWTPTNMTPHQGTIIKVSKDGAKLEVYATGVRAPNGLGMGPHDELTFSDNQGHWMPANRLNLVRQGGFYGMTPAAHRSMTFKTADGKEFTANPSEASARAEFKTEFWGSASTPIPTTHDLPLCWVPMEIDNSSGGQVWVPEGNKWGPLAGRMLFMSYGKCALFNVLQESVDGQIQGGLSRFPLRFKSGIMRGRFSPKDGQLYLSGLNVWQSNAVKDGCFYRVRYTGKPATLPVELHVAPKAVKIEFTEPLDPQTATDAQNFSVEQWNYAWTGNYGSPDISVANPRNKGRDLMIIESIKLSPDKKTLTIALPEAQPVMQMKIKFKINAADGRVLEQEIFNTIHKIPAA
ncbi:MAG: hypothetical protein JWL59_1650 [Chthoniobacteraceae bacterium]|nr:hypothetical protein [Chthoniobacteraceae bacterium]